MSSNKYGCAIEEILEVITKRKIKTKEELEKIKYDICKKYKIQMMLNSELLSRIKNPSKELKQILKTKPMRTQSGVSVVSVMTKPTDCPHGRCVMCPRGSGAPQSYTGKEPATMRAISNDYNPKKQVESRLKQFKDIGHPTDKIEVIVMGGTFTSMPKNYQTRFVKGIFDGLNGKSSRTLTDAHKLNENSKHRCVGLTVETRPDCCGEKEIKHILGLGATRVELGVQSVYNDVLKKMERGHSVEDTIEATKLLKDSAFKINYHLMTGLPGSSVEKDFKCFKEVFENSKFKPDMIKIYPTMVMKGTKLHKLWKRGEYKPYTQEELLDLLTKIKSITPEWVRIMRIQRDIPLTCSEAGVYKGNLRELLKKKVNCRCIRCREIGIKTDSCVKNTPKLSKLSYGASSGKEFFLQFKFKDDTLIGFLRLRLSDKAYIRELHIYGEQIPLTLKGGWQHEGYGKKLLEEAEKIAKKEGYNKLFVISGVGVRNYYRKLGYRKESFYMVKKLI